jgi:hypothetical protein
LGFNKRGEINFSEHVARAFRAAAGDHIAQPAGADVGIERLGRDAKPGGSFFRSE